MIYAANKGGVRILQNPVDSLLWLTHETSSCPALAVYKYTLLHSPSLLHKMLFFSQNNFIDQAMCEKLKKIAFCEEGLASGAACTYILQAQDNSTSHE